MPSFGARLDAVFDSHGHLCLGIDAHPFLLEAWGLPDTGSGAREFGLRAVEAATGTVGIVKPQIAFFERHGSAGYAALEVVLRAARDAGLLVIADVKRGDIGSTIDAYGEAWLTPGSPLEADAMTVVAYQGVGSVLGPIERARANDKGVFVLAATSNPEARSIQTAVLDGGDAAGATVAAGIVAEVDDLNAASEPLGPVGVVLGATVALDDYRISTGMLARTPILAPGFGEQGAELADIELLFDRAKVNVIANVGRGVLRAGPDGASSALERQSEVLREALDR